MEPITKPSGAEPQHAPIMDDDKGIVLKRELRPRDRFNLRVKADTPTKSLAGSIYNAIVMDKRELSLTFIGHGAAGQALKGIVAAQQMLSPTGLLIYFRVCYEKNVANLNVGDENLSVLKILFYLDD